MIKKITAVILTLVFPFLLRGTAYATTSFTENFDSYNIGQLSGQGDWQVASSSGLARFNLQSGYAFSAPRVLLTSQAQNQVLPIAIYKNLGSLPATDIVNLAFNYRLYLQGATSQRIGVVDTNNYEICGFGQTGVGSFTIEIPYTTLNSNWKYTQGDILQYGSGVTTSVWYYPIIRMNFETRQCSLSLDNGMSWSSDLQFYSGAATGSATLDKVVISLPETSSSPSYGSAISYIDGMVMWTGAVASPTEVGQIDLSAFSATNSGYLTLDLSGDVGYLSDNLTTCEVQVFQQDQYNNSPLFYQAGLGYEATIVLWNNGLTNYTQKFPNNTYIGHGYTPEDSHWQAEGVKVHYYAGQNTDLKFDYTCYENYPTVDHPDNVPVQVFHSQGVSSAYSDYNTALISTPSALLNYTNPAQDQDVCNGDWYCAIKQWVINTLQYLFMPKLTSMLTNTLTSLAQQKVPFAYVTAVSNLDWTFPNSSASALPTFNVTLNQVEVDKGAPPITLNATVPEVIRPVFWWIRTFSTIIFWLLFLEYISTVGRRLFK